MEPGDDGDFPPEGPRVEPVVSELYPFGMAWETRGLGQFGHLELQLVLELDEETH